MELTQYMENIKEIFKTAEEWATSEIDRHFENVKVGVLKITNEKFIEELVMCDTWEQVESIASRYLDIK